MRGGGIGREEHRLAARVLPRRAEPLDQGRHPGGDGLAVDLHGAAGIDLDQDEVILEVAQSLRFSLSGPGNGGLGVWLGDLQALVEHRGRRHQEEEDELEGDIHHRRQVELLDSFGIAA